MDALELPDGIRLTRQRRAVVDAVVEWHGSFTVLELFAEVRRTEPRLGLATVYRTVDLLRRAGSLRPLVRGDTAAYVRCHPGHHHHLVCVSYGFVEETELCAAPAAAEFEERHGFRAEGHEVEVYGTCRRCTS